MGVVDLDRMGCTQLTTYFKSNLETDSDFRYLTKSNYIIILLSLTVILITITYLLFLYSNYYVITPSQSKIVFLPLFCCAIVAEETPEEDSSQNTICNYKEKEQNNHSQQTISQDKSETEIIIEYLKNIDARLKKIDKKLSKSKKEAWDRTPKLTKDPEYMNKAHAHALQIINKHGYATTSLMLQDSFFKVWCEQHGQALRDMQKLDRKYDNIILFKAEDIGPQGTWFLIVKKAINEERTEFETAEEAEKRVRRIVQREKSMRRRDANVPQTPFG